MSFRILSLDGGGYRGLLASLMLVELQKEIDKACKEKGIPEKRIIDCFDLIAGTSTGSLIAAALSIGRSASEIRDIFINDGAIIFPTKTRLSLLFSAKHGPLFDGIQLEEMLRKNLGKRCLGEIEKAVLITAYDSWNNRPLAFRSYDHTCKEIQLIDACRGSSAYPAGFPAHGLKREEKTAQFFDSLINTKSYFSFDHSCSGQDGIPLVDGGIGANNPAALALAEYFGSKELMQWRHLRSSFIDKEKKPIVASFGTGQMPPCINYERGRRYSAKDWNGRLGNPLLEMIFVGYSRISDQLCRTVIGEPNYFRFQPVLLPAAVDKVLIEKSNIVRINSSEQRAFAGSAFQASPAVNQLFEKVCAEYFLDNYEADDSSPKKELRALAARIV
jgi:patatin-like phospholipase/acyl hydrolase